MGYPASGQIWGQTQMPMSPPAPRRKRTPIVVMILLLILLAGRAVLAKAQKLAWRIARATGATILIDYVNARVARGRGHLQLERVPFNTDLAIKMLSQFDHVILVNSKPPVGFFAYPDKPSTQYPAHAQLHFLSRFLH